MHAVLQLTPAAPALLAQVESVASEDEVGVANLCGSGVGWWVGIAVCVLGAEGVRGFCKVQRVHSQRPIGAIFCAAPHAPTAPHLAVEPQERIHGGVVAGGDGGQGVARLDLQGRGGGPGRDGFAARACLPFACYCNTSLSSSAQEEGMPRAVPPRTSIAAAQLRRAAVPREHGMLALKLPALYWHSWAWMAAGGAGEDAVPAQQGRGASDLSGAPGGSNCLLGGWRYCSGSNAKYECTARSGALLSADVSVLCPLPTIAPKIGGPPSLTASALAVLQLGKGIRVGGRSGLGLQ